jgi:hypothetical protein
MIEDFHGFLQANPGKVFYMGHGGYFSDPYQLKIHEHLPITFNAVYLKT